MGANTSNEKKVIITKESKKNEDLSVLKNNNGYYSVKENMVVDEVISFSNKGITNEKTHILVNEEIDDVY